MAADHPVYTDANPPKVCRRGHPLGPGLVLLGFVLCTGVDTHGGGHRTWMCRECGDVIVGDGHRDGTFLRGPLPAWFPDLRPHRFDG